MPVRIELASTEAGRRTLQLRVIAPPEDTDPADNMREADIEVVDRQSACCCSPAEPRVPVFAINFAAIAMSSSTNCCNGRRGHLARCA